MRGPVAGSRCMSAAPDPIRPVAIVGAGVSGFLAYAALRYAGAAAADITVFDDSPSFLHSWISSTGAIQQRFMRSESGGHFFPTDFPGFALVDALCSASPVPLLQSIFNRYTPVLGDIVAHANALASHYQFESSVRPIRIHRLTRERDPNLHFALYDANHRIQCRARNVLLAPGHGALAWPDACVDPEVRASMDGLLFHAYEAKPHHGQTVLVIGSGMSAATEWTNALREGGRVIAVRRAREVVQQRLSAPRCSFGGPWLDRYHALGSSDREAVLAAMGHGSFPGTGQWKRVLRDAQVAGRLQPRVGEVTEMYPGVNGGATVCLRHTGSERPDVLHVDVVIAATGFKTGWRAHEILRNLVEDYELQTIGEHLVLTNDCSISSLSADSSVLSVSGPAARWAFPASDSFAGMKYAARRFSRHVIERPRSAPLSLTAWWDMVRGGWPCGEEGDQLEKGGVSSATR